MDYTYRDALAQDAFQQLPLIDHEKLRREAADRGITLHLGARLVEQLEELDEVGAFCPIGFTRESEELTLREQNPFKPWSQYGVGSVGGPTALYSPWQLLYLKQALDLGTATVNLDWFLRDPSDLSVSDNYREFLRHQNARRSTLNDSWRDAILILVSLQNRYFPLVRGTLTKATATLIHDPTTHDFIDPFARSAAEFDPQKVMAELGINRETVKSVHQRLAIHGHNDDPLRRAYMLLRMAPFRTRAKFEKQARRAHDAYDAAEMLRRFYHDLTNELLPDADEIFDASGGRWKTELFGHDPRLGFTPKDLVAELKRHGLYPHAVHIAVEGETEREVFRLLLETLGGRSLDEVGIEISVFGGASKARLHEKIVRAARTYARFPIVVADREADVERDIEQMKREGLLADETAFIWDKNFEEDNFTDEELIAMARDIAVARGVELALDAAMLRERVESRRQKQSKDPPGVGRILLELAAHPSHGGVRISKIELATKMGERLLNDMEDEEDETGLRERRPVLGIVFDIIRVT